MKKVLLILTGFIFVGLVACGPSAEEKKAQEDAIQKTKDSTDKALLEKASSAASDSGKTAPADTTKK